MKVVLVTGASSGIGSAMVEKFASSGWKVMAAGRNQARLDRVASLSDNIHTWAGSLEHTADAEALIAHTVAELGQIDCLINNAGVLVRGDATQTTDADWRSTMTTNVDVPFFLSRAAIPHLKISKGCILNTASDWGLHAGKGATAYCVSKAAIVMMSKAMALDHGRDGIRVNAICPGDTSTPMLFGESSPYKDVSGGDAFQASLCEDSPNGRIGEPSEVAALAFFLASDDARHINGTAIPVDGGASA
ncbi:SDR family NAD(P)-dependent oxidoreductase [Marinomonas sp.]|uniref:SDR family NAD(P)-dependent oxidoreductase n=1 Tax=Marinomonas sp. TaxID=1904862 RepID=UPI003BAC76BC